MKKNLNGLDHGDHFDRLDGRRRRLLALAAAGPLLGWSASAGVPVEVCARLLAPALAAELGPQVIVENRPGASGSLGGDAVAKAPPDGAMIYFGASPTITINPNIQRKMSFDPGKDLLPIAPLLTYTNVLVVNPELPVRNVGELLAYARANPGKLFY